MIVAIVLVQGVPGILQMNCLFDTRIDESNKCLGVCRIFA